MKKAVFIITGLLLSLLQITVTWRAPLGWHNYGITICTVTALSVFDMKIGLISGGICGFFLDCIQGRVLGINIVFLLLTAVLVNFLSRSMNGKNMLAVMLLTFSVTLLTELVQYLVNILTNGIGNISFVLTKLIFPQAFINAICAVPIYLLVKMLWKKLKMQKDRWEY